MQSNAGNRPVRKRAARHNTELEKTIVRDSQPKNRPKSELPMEKAISAVRDPTGHLMLELAEEVERHVDDWEQEVHGTVRGRKPRYTTEKQREAARQIVAAAEARGVQQQGPRKSLASVLSRPTVYKLFSTWIIGDTPLITHAWSAKAKLEMLQKQAKATRGGREARDPYAEFISSLYEMSDGHYGFPAMGLKNCVLSVAHKDKGIAKVNVMAGLWIDAEIVSARPAFEDAICDMPLIRIYGSKPQNREDMVKIGSGLNKVASLAYRAQFTAWAFRITGKFNSDILTEEALAFLIDEAGMACGLGEWRNERKGFFGAFHRATVLEEEAWEDYAAGRSGLPQMIYQEAAE